MLLLHLGTVQLHLTHQKDSLWHQLIDRIRVLCAILFVFATALTPNGQWLTWMIYAIGLMTLILISQTPWLILCKRVAMEFVFVGSVLLGTLFHQTGEVLWQWGWFSITTTGLTVMGSVMLKSLLSLLMLNLLVLTTPIPNLLQALTELKMPPLLVAIFSSMYRYISVLTAEFATMRQAAIARNLMGRSHWQRQILGNMIGGLFIRTYDRGDRIYQAMLSRGYNGVPLVSATRRLRSPDRLFLVITVTWLAIGQCLGWLN